MPSGKSFILPVFSEKFWLHPPAHPPDWDITRPPAETEQCHQANLSFCQFCVTSSGSPPPAHPSDKNITRQLVETEQCHQENLSFCFFISQKKLH
jgi:hypothetical protein